MSMSSMRSQYTTDEQTGNKTMTTTQTQLNATPTKRRLQLVATTPYQFTTWQQSTGVEF